EAVEEAPGVPGDRVVPGRTGAPTVLDQVLAAAPSAVRRGERIVRVVEKPRGNEHTDLLVGTERASSAPCMLILVVHYQARSGITLPVLSHALDQFRERRASVRANRRGSRCRVVISESSAMG